MKEMICIVCPIGCRLTVTDGPEGITVTGNQCPRGETYAKEETTNPRRMVTGTVAKAGGGRLPVATSQPVPKAQTFAVITALRTITAPANTKMGDILVTDIAHTGADIVAGEDA